MRRIKKMVDPHRETRPGHTWGMDIVTFSDRSEEGCKYCVVLRDFASGSFKLLPVARRTTEALSEELMQWIRQMRNKPIFASMPYPVVSVIKTDNERAWSVDTAEWQELISEVGVEIIYVEPACHAKENGVAEAAVKTLEAVVKSILMAGNLYHLRTGRLRALMQNSCLTDSLSHRMMFRYQWTATELDH